jgi:hypothetical protein
LFGKDKANESYVVCSRIVQKSSGDDETWFGLRGNACFCFTWDIVVKQCCAYWKQSGLSLSELVSACFPTFLSSLYQSVADEGSRLFTALNFSLVISAWKISRIFEIGFSLLKGG